jgi:uncharacterized protein (DUF1697 family)
MPLYVALIRAIGPATHAKMRMAALRDACEDAGCAEVVTVGNTGNVILRSGRQLAGVRRLIQEVVDGFGLSPANEVFVRRPADMAEVVAGNPFPDVAAERPSEVGVCAFHDVPDWGPVQSYQGPEQVAMIGSHLVVAYPRGTASGIAASRLNVEKLLGVRMTMRNWRVFAGLAEKAGALARD